MADPAAGPIQPGPDGPHRPLRGPAFPIISRNSGTDAGVPFRVDDYEVCGDLGEPVPLAWRWMLGLLPDVERRHLIPREKWRLSKASPYSSFRRAPFVRDGVFDDGRATAPCSNCAADAAFGSVNGLGLCGFALSRLNSRPHTIAVYASSRTSLSATEYSRRRRSYLYLDGTFIRWIRSAFMTH